MTGKLYRLFEILTGLFFALVMIVLVVLDHRYFYMYRTEGVIPNIIFIAIGLIIYVPLFISRRGQNKLSVRRFTKSKPDISRIRRTLFSFTLALWFIEIVISWNIFFKTGWDCAVVVNTAKAFAFDNIKVGSDPYFSMYPNNVFLVALFSGQLKLANIFGTAFDYFPLIIIGTFLVSLSGFFMADIIRELTNNEDLTFIMWFVFAFLSGLSPWMSVPYSDIYSIISPVLAMWLFVTGTRRPIWLNWFLIGLTALIGYFIKPTALLTVFAIIPVALIRYFCSIKGAKPSVMVLKLVKASAGLLAALLLAMFIRSSAARFVGADLEDSKRFTPAHYLMMGMNKDSGGGYNQWDVNFSSSCTSVKERNARDFAQAWYRIKEKGLMDSVSFASQKMLTNFNDGSFAWGKEGEFYWYKQERKGILAPILRNYYYEEGAAYKWFLNLTQAVWIIILMPIPLCIFKEKEKFDYRKTALRLSTLAIGLFLMIFEARGRYLYLYSPIIYIVCALNIDSFIAGVKEK